MEVQFIKAGLLGLTDDQLHEFISYISDVIDSRKTAWKVPPAAIYSPEPAPTTAASPSTAPSRIPLDSVYKLFVQLDKTRRCYWKEEYEHIMHLLSPDLVPMNVYVDAERHMATIRYKDRDRAVIAGDVLADAYPNGDVTMEEDAFIA